MLLCVCPEPEALVRVRNPGGDSAAPGNKVSVKLFKDENEIIQPPLDAYSIMSFLFLFDQSTARETMSLNGHIRMLV